MPSIIESDSSGSSVVLIVVLSVIFVALLVVGITLLVRKSGRASAALPPTHVPQTCPKCGHPIGPGHTHCGNCGTELWHSINSM